MSDSPLPEAKEEEIKPWDPIAGLFFCDTYREITRKTSGLDTFVFSMLTKTQMESMLKHLAIQPGEQVLDLGCSCGSLTQLIAKQSGAEVLGMDLSQACIKVAREQFGNDATFTQRNFDEELPSGPFDVIYAIDTLYFSEDLKGLVKKLLGHLKPGGRLAIFWSQVGDPPLKEAPRDAHNTPVARKLRDNDVSYQTIEFTEEEFAYWPRQHATLEKAKAKLLNEVHPRLVEVICHEAEAMVDRCSKDQIRRYLYIAKK